MDVGKVNSGGNMTERKELLDRTEKIEKELINISKMKSSKNKRMRIDIDAI
jgi:hypothetical protein